jgi:hypothetical protein
MLVGGFGRVRGRLIFVGALLAVIVVAPSAAGAKEATYSADDYVDALTPVAESEFEGVGLSASPDVYQCVARQYVRGFTVRQLRKVGDPRTAAKERAKKKFDFARFGVTPKQEKTITVTVVSPYVYFTDDERDVILHGLFELTITYAGDDEKRAQAKALAAKLGGDPGAMFLGAPDR